MEASSPWTLNAPGVFVQGLRICDAGGQAIRTSQLARSVWPFVRGKPQRTTPRRREIQCDLRNKQFCTTFWECFEIL